MMTADFGRVEAGKLLLEYGANIVCLDAVSVLNPNTEVHSIAAICIPALEKVHSVGRGMSEWQSRVCEDANRAGP
jgi:hypothetical protein